jgi:hypothetical protein
MIHHDRPVHEIASPVAHAEPVLVVKVCELSAKSRDNIEALGDAVNEDIQGI